MFFVLFWCWDYSSYLSLTYIPRYTTLLHSQTTFTIQMCTSLHNMDFDYAQRFCQDKYFASLSRSINIKFCATLIKTTPPASALHDRLNKDRLVTNYRLCTVTAKRWFAIIRMSTRMENQKTRCHEGWYNKSTEQEWTIVFTYNVPTLHGMLFCILVMVAVTRIAGKSTLQNYFACENLKLMHK